MSIERLDEKINAIDRLLETEIKSLKELVASQRHDDSEALKVALNASQELAAKHNDLIRQQEKKDATYATKEEMNRLSTWQSKITGGLIILSIVGVANVVKIWTG